MSGLLNPVVQLKDVLEARIFRNDQGGISVEATIQTYGKSQSIEPTVPLNKMPVFAENRMNPEDIMWRIADAIVRIHS